MDAAPFLVEVGRALTAVSPDAVLIGNAGAALQGAPVTTVDFDFLFRAEPPGICRNSNGSPCVSTPPCSVRTTRCRICSA